MYVLTYIFKYGILYKSTGHAVVFLKKILMKNLLFLLIILLVNSFTMKAQSPPIFEFQLGSINKLGLNIYAPTPLSFHHGREIFISQKVKCREITIGDGELIQSTMVGIFLPDTINAIPLLWGVALGAGKTTRYDPEDLNKDESFYTPRVKFLVNLKRSSFNFFAEFETGGLKNSDYKLFITKNLSPYFSYGIYFENKSVLGPIIATRIKALENINVQFIPGIDTRSGKFSFIFSASI